MYKVQFKEAVRAIMWIYTRRYREYFENLYSDTGIWSEEQILDQYRKEALQRRQEIAFLLADKLSGDTILGRTSENTTVLSWRSKLLLVSWKESGDIRIITDLSIR